MIREYMTFRPIDRILIALYILYAIFILAALVYVDREYIRRDLRRWMQRTVIRAERFARSVREDGYDMDPRWMGYEQWKEERQCRGRRSSCIPSRTGRATDAAGGTHCAIRNARTTRNTGRR